MRGEEELACTHNIDAFIPCNANLCALSTEIYPDNAHGDETAFSDGKKISLAGLRSRRQGQRRKREKKEMEQKLPVSSQGINQGMRRIFEVGCSPF
jgi:hypothetical protein